MRLYTESRHKLSFYKPRPDSAWCHAEYRTRVPQIFWPIYKQNPPVDDAAGEIQYVRILPNGFNLLRM